MRRREFVEGDDMERKPASWRRMRAQSCQRRKLPYPCGREKGQVNGSLAFTRACLLLSHRHAAALLARMPAGKSHTVLHYTGADDDRGGVMSAVRALATADRFTCVLGVNPGFRQHRQPPLHNP